MFLTIWELFFPYKCKLSRTYFFPFTEFGSYCYTLWVSTNWSFPLLCHILDQILAQTAQVIVKHTRLPGSYLLTWCKVVAHGCLDLGCPSKANTVERYLQMHFLVFLVMYHRRSQSHLGQTLGSSEDPSNPSDRLFPSLRSL